MAVLRLQAMARRRVHRARSGPPRPGPPDDHLAASALPLLASARLSSPCPDAKRKLLIGLRFCSHHDGAAGRPGPPLPRRRVRLASSPDGDHDLPGAAGARHVATRAGIAPPLRPLPAHRARGDGLETRGAALRLPGRPQAAAPLAASTRPDKGPGPSAGRRAVHRRPGLQREAQATADAQGRPRVSRRGRPDESRGIRCRRPGRRRGLGGHPRRRRLRGRDRPHRPQRRSRVGEDRLGRHRQRHRQGRASRR